MFIFSSNPKVTCSVVIIPSTQHLEKKFSFSLSLLLEKLFIEILTWKKALYSPCLLIRIEILPWNLSSSFVFWSTVCRFAKIIWVEVCSHCCYEDKLDGVCTLPNPLVCLTFGGRGSMLCRTYTGMLTLWYFSFCRGILIVLIILWLHCPADYLSTSIAERTTA